MKIFNRKKPKEIVVYFGVPGSGKTTLAALHARKALKRGETVYSNVPIIGTRQYIPYKDFGVHMMEDCLILLDEASLEFNNRDYGKFPKTAREFFKLHRHYGATVEVYSQSYEDMDITIRRLATKFVLVKKSLIPFFITTRTATAIIDIKEEDSQFLCGYRWKPFSRRWHYMPIAWPMFDSYDAPVLKNKDWKIWNSKYADPLILKDTNDTLKETPTVTPTP
jgi:hypothetical protein